jgi:CRP-like cAMP-binding protein
MANRGVYVEHLRRVQLFAGLSTKELERIAAAGSEIDVKAGTVLVTQGHVGHDAFIVLNGSFVVRRNGREVAQLSAGEFVGELALLDDQPRSATVECTADGSVFVIGPRNFRAVFDDLPALTHKLLAALAGRIRDLDRGFLG